MYDIIVTELKDMSRKIKLRKDPYDCGVNLYKKRTIEIKPGITVLVGCNGIGKTTLLHNIKDVLRKENIPCMDFNNLSDGGHNARQESLEDQDFTLLSLLSYSSEGECIALNLKKFSEVAVDFIKTGKSMKKSDKFIRAVETLCKKSDEQEEIKDTIKERWFLFDAVDSGLSVDNIVELKEYFFKALLDLSISSENDIYIIVSANEYEMARGEQCMDVYNGKYLTFKDYEEYRNMVLESRKWKEERGKGE